MDVWVDVPDDVDVEEPVDVPDEVPGCTAK